MRFSDTPLAGLPIVRESAWGRIVISRPNHNIAVDTKPDSPSIGDPEPPKQL
jgi:hypothetical protein